jgi:hypothetical protein
MVTLSGSITTTGKFEAIRWEDLFREAETTASAQA